MSPSSTSASKCPARTVTTKPFVFVSTSSLHDPSTRKHIRSHVMRGKNRKPPARQAVAPPGSWINSSQSNPLPLPAKVPRSVGHDLTAFPFAEDLQPNTFELVYNFFTIIKQSMYPVEVCVDFELAESQWLRYLALDRAYVYSCLFTSRGIFDYLRDAKFGPVALAYRDRSLQLLRLNLTQGRAAVTDSTLAVVMSLALFSEQRGDLEEAETHMQGLYRLVNLRGGIETLRENYQLQIKICRADLGLALNTGRKPLFFADGVSWNPYIAKTDRKTTTVLHKLHPHTPDPRLVNVWLDLCEFARSANVAYQAKQKIRGDLFQEAVVSVQYRLMALEHEDGSSDRPVQEMMVRLGMLVFCATAFVQLKGLSSSPYLPARLKNWLLSAAMNPEPQSKAATQECSEVAESERMILLRLKLWLLYIAAISVMQGADHEGLLVSMVSNTLSALGFLSWTEVRDVLMEHVWIDWIDGKAGQALTEKALVCLRSSGRDAAICNECITEEPPQIYE